MKAYRLGILLAAAAALGAGFSCGSGGTTTSSGSASSTTSGTDTSSASASGTGGNGGGTTSSVASGTGGATTSTSTGTSTGTGSPMYGVCSQPCTMPADCCPPGQPSCPGASFPNNYACLKGACDGPHCGGTSDCTMQNPKLDCVTLSGASDCAFGCSTDGDCNAPLTCTGKDDNGKKYCVSMGGGCPDDAFCKGLGIGKCVKGVCSCEQDADCTSPGYTKCAK